MGLFDSTVASPEFGHHSGTSQHLPDSLAPTNPPTNDSFNTSTPSSLTSTNPTLLAELQIARIIGRGAFGNVYIGSLHGSYLAVKKISRYGSDVNIVNEVEIMKQVRHPNLVSLLCVSVSDNDGVLVMEYMRVKLCFID